jgi:4-alpha-glucanotransferase
MHGLRFDPLNKRARRRPNLGATVTLAIPKTFEQLAQAPSALAMASLEAACVTAERPNRPSAAGKYPNGSLALPLPREALESSEVPRRLAQILNRRSDMQDQEEISRAD